MTTTPQSMSDLPELPELPEPTITMKHGGIEGEDRYFGAFVTQEYAIEYGRLCRATAERAGSSEAQSYVEPDGCPTELAVLQRFWRAERAGKVEGDVPWADDESRLTITLKQLMKDRPLYLMGREHVNDKKKPLAEITFGMVSGLGVLFCMKDIDAAIPVDAKPTQTAATCIEAPTGQPPVAWTEQDKDRLRGAMQHIVDREAATQMPAAWKVTNTLEGWGTAVSYHSILSVAEEAIADAQDQEGERWTSTITPLFAAPVSREVEALAAPTERGWYWHHDGEVWRMLFVFPRPGHRYLAVQDDAHPVTGKRHFRMADKIGGRWVGPLETPTLAPVQEKAP